MAEAAIRREVFEMWCYHCVVEISVQSTPRVRNTVRHHVCTIHACRIYVNVLIELFVLVFEIIRIR